MMPTPRKTNDFPHFHTLRVLSQHGPDGGYVSRENFLSISLTGVVSVCFQLRCVGGCSCQANHYSARRARRVRNREQRSLLFTRFQKLLRDCRARLLAAQDRFQSLTAPTSRNAPQNSGCPAIANPRMKFSWSCLNRCGRVGAFKQYPRGVRYSSQGSLRKGRKRSGADDQSLAALGARLAQFRSALVPVMAAETATAPDLDPSVAVVVNRSERMKRYGQTNLSVPTKPRRRGPSSNRDLPNLASHADAHPPESKLHYPYPERAA